MNAKILIPSMLLLAACDPNPVVLKGHTSYGTEFNYDFMDRQLPADKDTRPYPYGPIWYERSEVEEVSAVEEAALNRFSCLASRAFMDREHLQQKLKEIHINQTGYPEWQNFQDKSVLAETWCWKNEILIGSGPIAWKLAHEIAHIAQGCNPPGPIDPGKDSMHANWTRDGIDAAAVDASYGKGCPQ